MLTEVQKKHLRRLGHQLRPVVLVGNAGLTDAVLAETVAALKAHELIKARLRVGERSDRDAAIERLCRHCDAELIQRVGNTALLYKRNTDKPRIQLPSAQT